MLGQVPEPLFGPCTARDGCVYATGHCSFSRSPDGAEDWLIYHAKDSPEYGFAGRTARAQPFTCTKAGMPHFGRPIPPGVPIPLPSGPSSHPSDISGS